MTELHHLLLELERVSKKSYRECITGLPSAIDQLDAVLLKPWIDLGIEIASGSGATGIKYFKESLALLHSLPSVEAQARVLDIAIRLNDSEIDEAQGDLALEFLRAGAEACAVIGESGLEGWVSMGRELGKCDRMIAVEFFRESPAVLRLLSFQHLTKWLALGMKLVTRNQVGRLDYMLALEFFRTSSRTLEKLDGEDIRLLVLEGGSRLADRSPRVAMAFLTKCPEIVAAIVPVRPSEDHGDEAVRREGYERFEAWMQAGIQACEYSPEAAYAYFSRQTKWAIESIETAMSGVTLRSMHRPLTLLVNGLSGETIRIVNHSPYSSPPQGGEDKGEGGHFLSGLENSAAGECPAMNIGPERPTCLRDVTGEISLPSALNVYSKKDENRRLYRVMAAHKAAHVEFGTHRVSFDALRDVIRNLHARYTRNHWPTSVWEFFMLYPSPGLAQDIWIIVEDARIDHRLAAEYPGLRRDMEWVMQHSVDQRLIFGALPPPSLATGGVGVLEMMVESLIRLSVNRLPDDLSGVCRDLVRRAAPLIAVVKSVRATGETSLRVTDELFQMIEVFSPPEVPSSECSSDRRSSPVQAGPTEEEGGRPSATQAYRPISNFVHRGDLSAPVCRQTGVNVAITSLVGVSEESERCIDPSGRPEAAARQMHGARENHAFVYEEWDSTIADYRLRWCRVVEEEAATVDGADAFASETLAEHRVTIQRLRRYFECFRPQSRRPIKRQLAGDDVDVDAAIERLAERRGNRFPTDRVYMSHETKERSVSAAFLIDMSGSTGRRLNDGGRRVIDVEKAALIVLCEAVEAVGDRYAMFGFSGRSNNEIRVTVLKEFHHAYDHRVKRRIGAVEPLQQNRDGAAIRHATHKLIAESAKTRLLILLSDGRPLDDGYDGEYAVDDTRMALLEATRKGIHPFCVTIDREAPEYAYRMFGGVHVVVVDDVATLPDRLPAIYGRLTA